MPTDGSALAADDTSPGWREALKRLVKGRTLAECVDSGRDNILHLRLIAALMVVLGHCGLTGAGKLRYDPIRLLLPQTSVERVGLMFFFLISGFLITLSFIRRPHLLRFLRARLLRIWPALAVCAVVLAFVVGPMLTSLPLSNYFAPGRADNPYAYALHMATLIHVPNALPGLFVTNPVAAGQVDSPVWTISVEAGMYLWVAGAGALRLFRFPWLTSIAIAAVFSVLILWPMSTGKFDYTVDWRLTVQGFFGAGAIACLLRQHVPVSTGLMIAIAVACYFASHTRHAIPFIFLAASYFVFWFAYVPRLPAIPHDLDLSYGTYLWAWPVQQSVVLLAGVREPLVLFAIAAPIALAIAAVSWVCIEKPALRLKDFRWRPARAVPHDYGHVPDHRAGLRSSKTSADPIA